MTYLGIDYGAVKIGLAKAFSETGIATPFSIIKNTANLANDLALIVAAESIDMIVVGYPLSLSGKENPQTAIVDDFVASLEALGVPVAVQDERFTSRGAISRGDDDSSAAALLLQMYIDAHKGHTYV